MDPTPSAPTIDATRPGIEGGELGNLKLHLHLHLSHMSGFVKPRVGALSTNPFGKCFSLYSLLTDPKQLPNLQGCAFQNLARVLVMKLQSRMEHVKSIRVFRNKRASAALSWDGLLNTQRIAAIRKWVGIISASPLCFDLGRRWNRLDPLGASLAEGLKNVFADKATGTLHAPCWGTIEAGGLVSQIWLGSVSAS